MSEEERDRRSVQTELGQYREDLGAEIVASTLASQLGSESDTLTDGKIDFTLLSVLEEKDIATMLYAAIRARKSRAWKLLFELFPKLKVSVGGRGRRDIIRMEGVARGGIPSVSDEMPNKPNIIARNTYARDWRKNAEKDRY